MSGDKRNIFFDQRSGIQCNKTIDLAIKLYSFYTLKFFLIEEFEILELPVEEEKLVNVFSSKSAEQK